MFFLRNKRCFLEYKILGLKCPYWGKIKKMFSRPVSHWVAPVYVIYQPSSYQTTIFYQHSTGDGYYTGCTNIGSHTSACTDIYHSKSHKGAWHISSVDQHHSQHHAQFNTNRNTRSSMYFTLPLPYTAVDNIASETSSVCNACHYNLWESCW